MIYYKSGGIYGPLPEIVAALKSQLSPLRSVLSGVKVCLAGLGHGVAVLDLVKIILEDLYR